MPFSVAAASAGGEEESGRPHLTEPGAMRKHHFLLNDEIFPTNLACFNSRKSLEQVSVIKELQKIFHTLSPRGILIYLKFMPPKKFLTFDCQVLWPQRTKKFKIK